MIAPATCTIIHSNWYSERRPCLCMLESILVMLGDVWDPQPQPVPRIRKREEFYDPKPTIWFRQYQPLTEEDFRREQNNTVSRLETVAPPELAAYAGRIFGYEPPLRPYYPDWP